MRPFTVPYAPVYWLAPLGPLQEVRPQVRHLWAEQLFGAAWLREECQVEERVQRTVGVAERSSIAPLATKRIAQVAVLYLLDAHRAV